MSVRFLCWEYWDFWRRQDHFRRFSKKSAVFRTSPKTSEVCRRRRYREGAYPQGSTLVDNISAIVCSQCFSLQKSELARKVLSFNHFTHGFHSLHGSELTYFWKLCQPRRHKSHFSIRREKLARKREPAWDWSFQPAGVRLTPKAWELAGISAAYNSRGDHRARSKKKWRLFLYGWTSP